MRLATPRPRRGVAAHTNAPISSSAKVSDLARGAHEAYPSRVIREKMLTFVSMLWPG